VAKKFIYWAQMVTIRSVKGHPQGGTHCELFIISGEKGATIFMGWLQYIEDLGRYSQKFHHMWRKFRPAGLQKIATMAHLLNPFKTSNWSGSS